MLLSQNKRALNIIGETHNRMEPKFETASYDNERYLLSNQLILLIYQNPDAGPRLLSRMLKDKFDVEVSYEKVIAFLRKDRLGNPEERKPLFLWAKDMVKRYLRAMQGDKAAMAIYFDNKDKLPVPKDEKRRCKERLLIIGIYNRLHEFGIDAGDLDNLMLMGDAKAKYCLLEAEDVMTAEYGFSRNGKPINGAQGGKPAQKYDFEAANRKIENLESMLERTNAMLGDLQTEFDEQIEESKAQELTDFFSELNSDRYGRILDELFVLRGGINELRKANYELPEAINGLMIMAIKLLQFVKDSHIDPMLKVGSVLTVKAKDIEDCNYEGSPFVNSEDTKNVRVVSPGWIFRDKKIQISRPQVKEEK